MATVASVFYYLRWIVPVFGRASAAEYRLDRGAVAIACASAAFSAALGVGSGAVLTLG